MTPSESIFVKPERERDFSLLMDFQLAEVHSQWRDGSQSAPQWTLCMLEDLDRL